MKLKQVPTGSTIKFNGNTAEVISHGSMGCRINVIESKKDSISLGKQILSNKTKISLLRGRN